MLTYLPPLRTKTQLQPPKKPTTQFEVLQPKLSSSSFSLAMPTADDDSSAANTIGAFRRLLLLKKFSDAPRPPDRNPLIPSKKNSFAAAFRSLGCASSAAAQAYAPPAAAVRSSADWQGSGGRRARKRRPKQKKRKDRKSYTSGSGSAVASASAADVWCAPGIAFGADASPVDCVVAQHRRGDSERVHRERAYNARRVGDQEHVPPFMDSPSVLEEPLFRSDLLPPGHLRLFRGYRRSPGGLEEMMMFQTRLLLGQMDSFDQYRDLRLDVDNMTYEELLELGDKIGHVSTGLREEEISCNLMKIKHSIFSPSLRISGETEWKCSICQEEYDVDDEIGKLECGHSYHIHCIKQWLLRKNACPVCKTAVSKS